MSMPQKIDMLYAWIITEEDGQEGVPAMSTDDGQWMPMIGADTSRIESLRKTALEVARMKNLPIKLVKFSNVTVLETHNGLTQ